jgi:hypothetical protein
MHAKDRKETGNENQVGTTRLLYQHFVPKVLNL